MEIKTISIIGCGWLGMPLAKKLLDGGYQIKGSTRSAEKAETLKRAGIEAFQLNAGPETPPEAYSELSACDLVFVNIPPGRRRSDVESWYPGLTASLLGAFDKSKCSKIIWTSSTGVYGSLEGLVTEDSEPVSDSASSVALLAAEKLVRDSKLDWMILRLAGLAGPDRHPGRWLAGKKGMRNGGEYVNLVHQADILEIVKGLLEKPSWGEVFNICSDKHPVKRDYYPVMAGKIGLDAPEYLAESSEKEGKKVSNYKIKSWLDYRFKYPDPSGFQ